MTLIEMRSICVAKVSRRKGYVTLKHVTVFLDCSDGNTIISFPTVTCCRYLEQDTQCSSTIVRANSGVDNIDVYRIAHASEQKKRKKANTKRNVALRDRTGDRPYLGKPRLEASVQVESHWPSSLSLKQTTITGASSLTVFTPLHFFLRGHLLLPIS